MKKILVVEDTLENLEVAKLFFSKVVGFEFIYATNREEAEKCIDEVYAVITDRSIPMTTDANFIDCELTPEDCPFGEQEVIDYIKMANGFYILYKSYFEKKPVIMISDHGNLILVWPAIVESPTTNCSSKTKLSFSNSSTADVLQDILFNIKNNPSAWAYKDLCIYGNRIGRSELCYCTKTEVEAWEIAWKRLQEQF